MKTNKILGGIALVAALATGMAAFGAGGDIFEIRPVTAFAAAEPECVIDLVCIKRKRAADVFV